MKKPSIDTQGNQTPSVPHTYNNVARLLVRAVNILNGIILLIFKGAWTSHNYVSVTDNLSKYSYELETAYFTDLTIM